MESPQLKPILLTDRPVFDQYFSTISDPLADTTFILKFMWSEAARYSWALINGYLCVFGFLHDRYVIWGPASGESYSGKDFVETIEQCFKIAEELNTARGIPHRAQMIYIPECLSAPYGRLEGFTLGEFAAEYVYNTSDLSTYPGSKYSSKRYLANRFSKEPEVRVERFNSEAHPGLCLDFATSCLQRKLSSVNTSDGTTLVGLQGPADNRQTASPSNQDAAPAWEKTTLAMEHSAIQVLLRNAKELNVDGILVYLGQELAGFSLGVEANAQTAYCLARKNNQEPKGCVEYLIREYAKCCVSKAFISELDDCGIEALKVFKLGFKPVKLVRAFSLERA